MNPDNLAKHVHDDFRRVVHPKSISLPAQNKDEWLKEMRAFLGFATGVEVGHNPCYSSLFTLG